MVHSINPKQLDRLRDRFSVAGAKDDRRDGYVLADGVRTDRRLFRRLHVADPRLVELRAWSRLAEELREERVRLNNLRKSGLDFADDGGSDQNPTSGQGARFAERRYQCPSGGAGSRSSPAAAKRGVEDAGLEVGHASPDHQTCRSQPIASDNVR